MTYPSVANPSFLDTVGRWFQDRGDIPAEAEVGANTASWYDYAQGTREELRFGPCPPWLEDNQDVASAVIPDADGSAVTGVY